MTKVMNHRIEKLSTLLNSNETKFNVTNKNEITIKRENVLNDTSEIFSCSSSIKVEPLLKRSKINSFIMKHKHYEVK